MAGPVYPSDVRVEYRNQTHELIGGTAHVTLGTANVYASITGASGLYLYLVAGSGLQVVNITDREVPVLIGATTDLVGLATNQAITGLALDSTGQYLYVPDGGTNLYTLDLVDPTQPNLVNTLVVSAGGSFHVINRVGTKLYLLSDSANNLQEISISTPSTPSILNTVAAGSIALGVSYAAVTPDTLAILYPSSVASGTGQIGFANTNVSPPTLATKALPAFGSIGGPQIYCANNVNFLSAINQNWVWFVGLYDAAGTDNFFWLVYQKGATWGAMAIVSDTLTGPASGAGKISPRFRIQNEPQNVRGIGAATDTNRLVVAIVDTNADAPAVLQFWKVTADSFVPRLDDSFTLDEITSVQSFSLLSSDGFLAGGGSTLGNVAKAAVVFHPFEVSVVINENADQLEAGWEDISEYVEVDPGIKVQYGIQGTGPRDRVASTGTMNFRVKNFGEEGEDFGKFSPEHPDLLDNFRVGAPIRLIVGDVGVATALTKPDTTVALNPNSDFATGLVAAYLFNEGTGGNGAQVSDYSGNGHHGIIESGSGTPSFWTTIDPAHDPAFIVDKSPITMWCRIPHHADFNFSSEFSIVCGYAATISDLLQFDVLVGKATTDSWNNGFTVYTTSAAGKIDFGFVATLFAEAITDLGGVGFTPYNDTNYHQAVFTFKNSTDTENIYVDGAFRKTKTNATTNPTANTNDLYIGRQSNATQRNWSGYVFYAYFYNRELSAAEVASIAERPYQMFGSPSYAKFFGTIKSIAPRSGQYRERYVDISCVDTMDAFARIKPQRLDVQLDVTATELVTQLVNNASHLVYGDEVSIDATDDIYPFAFDGAKDESTTIMAELQKLALSERGYFYIARQSGPLLITGDGGIRFESRDTRRNSSIRPFVLENLTDLMTTHTSEEVVNRVQVRVFPRAVDDVDTTVLFTRGGTTTQTASAQAQLIKNKATITFNAPYRDPTELNRRVAGVDMQYPVTTDFRFRTQKNGTGGNLNNQLSIIVNFGGSSAEVTVRNNGPQPGFLTFFQLRGRGIYTYEPVTVTKEDLLSVMSIGPIDLVYEMPYIGEPSIADEVAEKILTAYQNPRTFIKSGSFFANEDNDAMTAFLTFDIGDKIPIAEAVHGFTDFLSPSVFWRLEEAGFSELGTTTKLGDPGTVYIIQNIEFDITKGDLINVRWGLIPGDIIL